MKIFVVGNRGQLGSELMRAKWPEGFSVEGADLPELNILQPDSLRRTISAKNPDWIINSAAYTAVDKAENEPQMAFAVNRDGAKTLAQLANDLGAANIYISTDYVFDGKKQGAYVETDKTAPLGVYGISKAEGEAAVRESSERHLIVRTSWLYGFFGANFLKTMLRLAKERDELRIVSDQWGCPTSAKNLAEALVTIVSRSKDVPDAPWGTYHYAGTGRTNWHGFASEIIALQTAHTGKRPKVTPIKAAEYNAPAPRPENSELDSSKIARVFGAKLVPWQEATREVVSELFSQATST